MHCICACARRSRAFSTIAGEKSAAVTCPVGPTMPRAASAAMPVPAAISRTRIPGAERARSANFGYGQVFVRPALHYLPWVEWQRRRYLCCTACTNHENARPSRSVKKNNGVFPFTRVYEIIDGRQEVRAHGTREMPIWGKDLSFGALTGIPYYNDEAFVRARVLALTEYIYRLQAK